jgi:hypothetical protein
MLRNKLKFEQRRPEDMNIGKGKSTVKGYKASRTKVYIHRWLTEFLELEPESVSRLKGQLGNYSPAGVRRYLLSHPHALQKAEDRHPVKQMLRRIK